MPGLARRGAVGGRAPETNPSAGATSVKGRQNSSRCAARSSRRPSPRAATRDAARPTAVLMKFSMSLFRIPGAFERRAEPALEQRSGRRADDDREQRVARHERRARPRPRRAPSAPAMPAAVPSSDIAPDVPGGTRAQRRDRPACAAPTPCRFRSRLYRCRRRRARRRTPAAPGRPTDRRSARASAAIAATPVLAIALPAPRRPPRSSAMPSTILRVKPEARRHRRGEERDQQQDPALPAAAREDRDADERAGERAAGDRHRPGAIPADATSALQRERRRQRVTATSSSRVRDARDPSDRATRATHRAGRRRRPRGCRRAAPASSRRAPRRTAATIGATIAKSERRRRHAAGRHHQASTTPAAAPQIANASVPLTVLSRFHGHRGAADRAAGQRRDAVADREDAPRRGGDVGPPRKGEQQQQHRQRVVDDAVQAARADRRDDRDRRHARQQEDIEGERAGRQRDRLPPRRCQRSSSANAPIAM